MNTWQNLMVFQILYFLISYNNSTIERRYIGQLAALCIYLIFLPIPCKIAIFFFFPGNNIADKASEWVGYYITLISSQKPPSLITQIPYAKTTHWSCLEFTCYETNDLIYSQLNLIEFLADITDITLRFS